MPILRRRNSYKKIIEKVITLLSRKSTKKSSQQNQDYEQKELGQPQMEASDQPLAAPARMMIMSEFSSENSLTSTLFLPDEEDAWSNEDTDIYTTFPDRNWMDIRY